MSLEATKAMGSIQSTKIHLKPLQILNVNYCNIIDNMMTVKTQKDLKVIESHKKPINVYTTTKVITVSPGAV